MIKGRRRSNRVVIELNKVEITELRRQIKASVFETKAGYLRALIKREGSLLKNRDESQRK